MRLRTAVGRARGLGAARSGVDHFWRQRLTAIALVPLALWLVMSLISVGGADYATVKVWLGRPLNATLMLLAVLAAVWHAQLGVQVVVEDYIHHAVAKWSALIGLRLAAVGLATFMAVSILKVAVGG
jgi:succinate dehydrogenase / fumarate reductase membrane anchor subunit